MMVRPKSMGRKKIEIKKIENKNSMYCSFSKRRKGLFNKAHELSTFCGANVAVIVFSPKEKLYTYGEPSVDSVMDRFLREQSMGGNLEESEFLFDQHIEDLELHELEQCKASMEEFMMEKRDQLDEMVTRRVPLKDFVGVNLDKNSG